MVDKVPLTQQRKSDIDSNPISISMPPKPHQNGKYHSVPGGLSNSGEFDELIGEPGSFVNAVQPDTHSIEAKRLSGEYEKNLKILLVSILLLCLLLKNISVSTSCCTFLKRLLEFP